MPRLTRRRLLAGACVGVAGAGVSAASYALWIEPDRLGVTRLALKLPDWPPDQPPIRVGQLTDLHCHSDRAVRLAGRAAAMLMAHEPDIVVLTGDYVTGHAEQWAEAVADALAPVADAPLGAYAVLGNHDYSTNSDPIIEREMSRLGIPVLRNEPVRVRGRENLWLIGVDSISTGRADAHVASIGVPEDAVRLMLVHEPDFADFADIRPALQLSGHSHGGQVRLPGLPVYSPPGARKYVMGYYRSAPHPVWVSRGVGTIGPPVRFRCPPEAVVLDLRSAQASAGGTASRVDP